MSQPIGQIISEALRLPPDAAFYRLSQELASAYPDRFLLETEDARFQIDMFAWEGHCSIKAVGEVHNQFEWSYNASSGAPARVPYNSWREVSWTGSRFLVVSIGLRGNHCRSLRHFLVADTKEKAKALFAEVCLWYSQIRGEVLVFSGHWHKDRQLYEWMKTATLDSLVLEGDMLEQLKHEFRSFFEAEELYDKYGIAWKRGVLFLGAPGNGKTHAIRGLLNLVGRPILYVKTFKERYATDQEGINSVFERAREAAPCVLVLEDLDSLIDDGNRAYFLNEMDGFASNRGILTVATTNHPEKLDSAILERPSRFDRKYTFYLPNMQTRLRYLSVRNDELEEAVRLTPEQLGSVAEKTEGFSFAYLKELMLSALMSWIERPGERLLADLMEAQTETLLAQMRTAPNFRPPFDSEDDEDDED